MYAVVRTGGKQYRVAEGETFRFEKLPGGIGETVTFDDVLLYAGEEELEVGQPTLDHIAVEGRIVEQGKSKKIIVFKYKRRKRYRRRQGHRQQFTAVRIERIKDARRLVEDLAEKEDLLEEKQEKAPIEEQE